MHTATFNLYNFSELSPDAQILALSRYREQGLDAALFDDQFLLQEFRDRLSLVGLDRISIGYTDFNPFRGFRFLAQVSDIPLFLSSIGSTLTPDPAPSIAFGPPREYNTMDIRFWVASDTLSGNTTDVDTLIDINDPTTDHGPLYQAAEAWRRAQCLEMSGQLDALYNSSTGDAALGLKLEELGAVYLESGVLLVDHVRSAY